MDVYWLEQTESDVPAGNGWLSPAEAAHLETMRFPKRRADWRLGRWTAKTALAAYLKSGGDLCTIELRPAADGAPEAYFADDADGTSHSPGVGRCGCVVPVSLSLSHSNGIALCAVAPPGAALGCDLETIEARSDNFLADYFTTEEQEFIARAPAGERPRLLAVLWSAKESALKALRTGLRLDTRSALVTLIDESSPAEWRPLQVQCAGARVFDGWWQQDHLRVRTLVAAPPPSLPMCLDIAAAPVLQ